MNFTINCSEPVTNDFCEGALALNCGDLISGSNQFLTIDNDNIGCLGAPDSWYSFTGTGEILQFNQEDDQLDFLYFEIYDASCQSELISCEDAFSLDNTSPSRNILTQANIDYLIRLETENSFSDNFSFSISCVDEIENDECINATNIACGDIVSGNLSDATFNDSFDGCDQPISNDLWYTFVGTGDVYGFTILENDIFSLQLDIRTEPCTDSYINCHPPINLELQNNSNIPNAQIPTSQGVQYWIKVSSPFSELVGLFSFSIDCIEPLGNDLCTDAIPLACDQTYDANLQNATFSSSFNGCDFEDQPDAWYTLMGDGLLYSIDFESSTTGFFRIQIYTGTCQSDFLCFQNVFIDLADPQYRFITVPGEQYFFRAYGDPGFIGDISFSLSCVTAISGDECEDPLPLNCGDTISGNTTDATISPIGCYNSESRDLWYSFIGDGRLWTYEYVSSELRHINFEIYESDCPSYFDSCVQSFKLREQPLDNQLVNFPSANGQQYYVKVQLEDFGLSDPYGNFEFNVSCTDILINDMCENAIPVSSSGIVTSSTSNASIDLPNQNCFVLPSPSLWYSITGQGDTLEFSYISSMTDEIFITVYNSCGLQQNDCGEPYYLNAPDFNSFTFLAEDNTDYFFSVQIGSELNALGDFSFEISSSAIGTNVNTEEIPTMSQWALICLFLLLNIIAVMKIRETNFVSFDV